MFASERVHLGVQLHAPRLRVAMAFGVWHTGEGNSFRTGPETEEGLTGDSETAAKLRAGGSEGGVCVLGRRGDNLQSKWAATEGDSVSGGNGTARISPSKLMALETCPGFRASRETALSQVLLGLLHRSSLPGRLRPRSQRTAPFIGSGALCGSPVPAASLGF